MLGRIGVSTRPWYDVGRASARHCAGILRAVGLKPDLHTHHFQVSFYWASNEWDELGRLIAWPACVLAMLAGIIRGEFVLQINEQELGAYQLILIGSSFASLPIVDRLKKQGDS